MTETEFSYRLWNPDHEHGFYFASDAEKDEIYCYYCGGLTKMKTIKEHYKKECESFGGNE